jgi:2-iminobutanoate/2-iminopropanoate deaminase
MNRHSITSAGAPSPVGPYSQAIGAGRLVFCAGQVGLDPTTGQLVEGLEGQAERALRNLGAVLDAAGVGYADVVKTTCFLVDPSDFAAFNTVYGRFVTDPPPARSTIIVAALPLGARVEVEAIAVRAE